MATAEEEEDMHNTSLKFKCFYCNEYFTDRVERITHREQYHPDKLNYPTKDSFDNRLDR